MNQPVAISGLSYAGVIARGETIQSSQPEDHPDIPEIA